MIGETPVPASGTHRLMPYQECFVDAQAPVYFKNFSMCWQPIAVYFRQRVAQWFVTNSKRRPQRLAVDPGNITRPYGRSWSEKRVQAGIISLSGIRCSHALTPGSYSAGTTTSY